MCLLLIPLPDRFRERNDFKVLDFQFVHLNFLNGIPE